MDRLFLPEIINIFMKKKDRPIYKGTVLRKSFKISYIFILTVPFASRL